MTKPKEVTESEEATSKELKPCFIITPIGAIDSETFKKTSGLISSVLKPVLEEFDFKAVPAYEIPNSGSINRQILKSILFDKLVIANLTGLNPNVMYELAVRHAARLPVIIMAEHGTNLPFDITDQRAIFYHDSLLGSEDAKPKLRNAIGAALSDKNIDNPIYQVVEESNIIKAEPGKDQSINDYIIRRFDQLESNINALSQTNIAINQQSKSNYSASSTYIDIVFTKKPLAEIEKKIILQTILKGSDVSYSMIPIITGYRVILNIEPILFQTVLNRFTNSTDVDVINWKL